MGHVTGKTALTASMFLCVILPALPLSAEVRIVKEGKPAAAILVADNAGPVAYDAANELARVIGKSTGVMLRIYPESEFDGGDVNYPAYLATKILVGDSRKVRDLSVDVSKLPKEGFIIKTAGRYLIIAGRDDVHSERRGNRGHRHVRNLRGTYYGVCAFLENHVGARWLWPGDLGEVVPQSDDLVIGNIDHTESPALPFRLLRCQYMYCVWWRPRAMNRCGINSIDQFAMAEELEHWTSHQRLGASFTISGTEYTKEWLEDFADDHPEYFALQPSGERLLEFGGGYRVRMCLSNPEVIDETAKRVVAFLDANPKVDGYGIAPSDIFGSYCVCNECKKVGPTTSDLVAYNVAEVARKVGKLRPGKHVGGLAYHAYNDAPKTDIRFPDNVVLRYVGVHTYAYLCDDAWRRTVDEWDGWAKISDKMIWRPNNFAWLRGIGVPLVYVTKLGADFRHFYKNKMVGTDFDRIMPRWAMSGLNYYVAARLNWNPEADVDRIVEDYCRSGFGPAAPQVRAYFAMLEKITDRLAAQREYVGQSTYLDVPALFEIAELEELRAMLDNAREVAAGDETIQKRIAFICEALDVADVEVPIHKAVELARKNRPSAEQIEEYRTMLEERERFLESRGASRAANAPDLLGTQDWLAEQLFVTEKPGAFDDLPNSYDVVMDLPEHWKFKPDLTWAGEKDEWYALEYDDSAWNDIRVGEFWERQGYGDLDSRGWYRLNVELPKELDGKNVQLCFGAADETAMVYVNGELAGEHDIGPSGWDKRFFIDVTEHIKAGQKNLIAVRVVDSVGAGGLWKPIKVVVPKEILYPVRDAYMNSVHPGTAFGKNPSLAMGANDCLRTLIAWQLPEKIEISNARVVLPLRYHKGRGSYAVYPLGEAFHEPKATWKAPFGAEPWKDGAGAGAAMKGEPVARIEHGPVEDDPKGTPQTLEFDVTELARKWTSGEENFGILIVQDPLDENVSCAPHSREVEDAGLRPRLELKLTSARVKQQVIQKESKP